MNDQKMKTVLPHIRPVKMYVLPAQNTVMEMGNGKITKILPAMC